MQLFTPLCCFFCDFSLREGHGSGLSRPETVTFLSKMAIFDLLFFGATFSPGCRRRRRQPSCGIDRAPLGGEMPHLERGRFGILLPRTVASKNFVRGGAFCVKMALQPGICENRRKSKIAFAAVAAARRVRCPVWVAETGRLGLLDSQAVRNAAIYAALPLFSRFQPPRRPRIRPLEA